MMLICVFKTVSIQFDTLVQRGNKGPRFARVSRNAKDKWTLLKVFMRTISTYGCTNRLDGSGKVQKLLLLYFSPGLVYLSPLFHSLSTPPFCHIWEGDTVGSPFIWTNYIQIWTADCGGRSYKGPFKMLCFTARLPWKDFFYICLESTDIWS